MMLRTFFILLCTSFIVNISKAGTTTINVAAATGATSNRDLIQAFEDAAKKKGTPVIINMERGTYYFSRSESVKKWYYVSNTTSEEEDPDPTKHIALLLSGLKNVTLNGNGSTLVMTGEMTSFVIDECDNITFKNLNFDYQKPTQTEVKVVENGDDFLVVQVHPTSQYRIKDGKLEWYGDGWSFTDGIAQTYDYKKDITWRSWSPMSGLQKAEELEKNKLRLYYAEKPEIEVGHVFQMRDAIRDEVCGFVHKSRNVLFQNVNFYYLGNFGVVCQYSGDVTFDKANFAPEPDGGRTNAGFADFIQVSGCKGLIDIKNSRFTGAHDDPINIHGTHLKVMDFYGENMLMVRFMHPQSYGFEAFFKDDEIEFISSQSLRPVASAKISRIERLNPREMLLTLAEKLPENVIKRTDLVVENVTWTPEVKITNNYFSRIPTRGILVTTRKKVLIEGNTFFRMQMSGILIANDALSWYESGRVNDVTIRNNYFVECGVPVINIVPENKIDRGAVHRNIRIEDNKFKLGAETSGIIYVKSVDGLVVDNNQFMVENPENVSVSKFVRIENCQNVDIRNTKVEKLLSGN